MKKLWKEFFQTVKKIRKHPKDVWWYIQGTFRTICYNNYPWMIRKHILEQFEHRKIKAAPCLENKSCKFCGCRTPDVFFSNKACSLSELSLRNRKLLYQQDDPCYGVMMSKTEWNTYKNSQIEVLKINDFDNLKNKIK